MDEDSGRQAKLGTFEPAKGLSRLNACCWPTWRVLLHVGFREGLADPRSTFSSKALGRAILFVAQGWCVLKCPSPPWSLERQCQAHVTWG